jgi:hypothetical protein
MNHGPAVRLVIRRYRDTSTDRGRLAEETTREHDHGADPASTRQCQP